MSKIILRNHVSPKNMIADRRNGVSYYSHCGRLAKSGWGAE